MTAKSLVSRPQTWFEMPEDCRDILPEPLGLHCPSYVDEVIHEITYDNPENRFLIHVVNSILRRLHNLEARCSLALDGGSGIGSFSREQTRNLERRLQRHQSAILSYMQMSFLNDLPESTHFPQDSHVYLMDPRYRTIGLMHLLLNMKLDELDQPDGHPFRLSHKRTWELYEYWTFLSLVNVLQEMGFSATEIDLFKMTFRGLEVTLQKGERSRVCLTKGDVKIRLSYNREYMPPGATFTHKMIPDVSMKISKGVREKLLVFDAKYRIGEDGGPKDDDVDKMHTYRDAIGHFETEGDRRVFVHDIRGAYIMFPSGAEGYRSHRYYQSLKQGIGGIPLLPGKKAYLNELLRQEIYGG